MSAKGWAYVTAATMQQQKSTKRERNATGECSEPTRLRCQWAKLQQTKQRRQHDERWEQPTAHVLAKRKERQNTHTHTHTPPLRITHTHTPSLTHSLTLFSSPLLCWVLCRCSYTQAFQKRTKRKQEAPWERDGETLYKASRANGGGEQRKKQTRRSVRPRRRGRVQGRARESG